MNFQKQLGKMVGVAIFTGLIAVSLWVMLNSAVSTPVHDKTNSPVSQLPNIIFIMVDATRADHVSAYGYGRNTTPNLDSWLANQGAIFTQATVPTPWTYPTNAANFTGRRPSTLGVTWADDTSSIPTSEMLLPEYLQGNGYYTAGFVAAHYQRAHYGFNQGFNVYQEHIGSSTHNLPAEQLNSEVINWLDTTWTPILSGTQPLFLYVYYFDPHTWYTPPPPYDTLYDSTYTGTLTADVYQHGYDVVSGHITPTQRDIEHLIALYDGEITYWDVYLGQLLTHLDGLGVLEHSILVLSSDHGQMFGEHGKWLHRNSLYEEVLRVPLVMRYTDVISPGLVITTPVQTIDIMPTLLEWIGLPQPGNLDGLSLASLIQGQGMTETHPIFSEQDPVADPNHSAYWIAPHAQLYAVREGNWKFIHQIGLPLQDGLYEIQPASLYEPENLINQEPETAESLYQLMVNELNLPTEFTFLPVVTRP
jgi:arylsulfatase A-like enzyme